MGFSCGNGGLWDVVWWWMGKHLGGVYGFLGVFGVDIWVVDSAAIWGK